MTIKLNLDFTLERVENKSINFLDLKIKKMMLTRLFWIDIIKNLLGEISIFLFEP